MIFKYHQRFFKNYKKRIQPHTDLNSHYKKRLEIFINDPTNPILNDHKLKGNLEGFRSFSITGDIRIIYQIRGEEIWLYDIGTHNQVY